MDKNLWYAKEDHIPLLGHRGIKAKYPENTMISFKAAIDSGVDLIEFDINVTKDMELVIIHDNTIDRTSDHTGLTRDYTLSELKSFDFGSHFDKKFKEEQIPTFRELLEYVTNRTKTLLLNVEIKDYTHECVDMTIAMLEEFGMTERSVIACFNAEIIRYTKEKYPFMRVQGFPGRFMSNFTEETYDCMFGMGIPINWDADDEQLKKDINFAKSKGILAWLFSADNDSDVQKCIDLKADNITSNNAELALDYLRSVGLHK